MSQKKEQGETEKSEKHRRIKKKKEGELKRERIGSSLVEEEGVGRKEEKTKVTKMINIPPPPKKRRRLKTSRKSKQVGKSGKKWKTGEYVIKLKANERKESVVNQHN